LFLLNLFSSKPFCTTIAQVSAQSGVDDRGLRLESGGVKCPDDEPSAHEIAFMSSAIRFVSGRFGRVALLAMDASLVTHAHHHCHLLIKTAGADALFQVCGVPCPLTDHEAVLINAWSPHAYEHAAPAGCAVTEVLALYIEPDWLRDCDLTPSGRDPAQCFALPQIPVTARLRQAALTLAALLAAGDPDAACEAALTALLLSAFAGQSHTPRAGLLMNRSAHAPSDARIRRAIAILHANPGDIPDMAMLASRCGLSRAHFFELFRRNTNLSPLLYVNELRMEAAFVQLAQTHDAVAHVASGLGFSAPGHFTRFFRNHIGVTPRAYRSTVRATSVNTATA